MSSRVASQEVTLVPLAPAHAEDTFRWVSDPEVARNLGLRIQPSLERTRAWIARAAAAPDVRAFAILADGVHVGNVIVDQIDSYLATARVSIYLGEPAARGAGIGRRSMALAARTAFDELGMRKVWLVVHPKNTAAVRLYTGLGFVLEGVLREEFPWEGERGPAWRMGLLAGELLDGEPARGRD